MAQDDFRIATNNAIGEQGGSGNDAGRNDGGASVRYGIGGTFSEHSAGSPSTTGSTSADATGGTSADATGGTSADATGGTSTDATGGTSADATGGTSADATGGSENTGGAAGSSSTGVLCSPGAFGNVEIITGLGVTGELWSPSLSADGSTLYFEAFENNYNHVYAALRTGRGPAFSPAKLVSISGAPSIQASPFLSADGRSMYFATSKIFGSTDRDIWIATRADTSTSSFSSAQALAGVNSTSPENSPWVSLDQSTLLFTSSRSGGAGGNDIWMATWSTATGQFNAPTNLTAVNSRYSDGSAILSNDGLTLYFSSDRGSLGVGESDIWAATRVAITETDFGTMTALTAINSTGKETDPVLSQDETELFFISERQGNPQIYRATRSCAPSGL